MFKHRHCLKIWPLALLLLAGCSDARSENEMVEIATDVTSEATYIANGQFAELEARIDDLESEISDHQQGRDGRTH